ncbi:hypothetical protein TIFTF001_025462 [Ficus carica]|uniref:Uncharacterized protein n=1 Tax=Ficus carica TaxID=3494 RepID=A0AA88AYU8_FICCA|nr:hypothetical protein TIFTF001_025462 [Ficus carica]
MSRIAHELGWLLSPTFTIPHEQEEAKGKQTLFPNQVSNSYSNLPKPNNIPKPKSVTKPISHTRSNCHKPNQISEPNNYSHMNSNSYFQQKPTLPKNQTTTLSDMMKFVSAWFEFEENKNSSYDILEDRITTCGNNDQEDLVEHFNVIDLKIWRGSNLSCSTYLLEYLGLRALRPRDQGIVNGEYFWYLQHPVGRLFWCLCGFGMSYGETSLSGSTIPHKTNKIILFVNFSKLPSFLISASYVACYKIFLSMCFSRTRDQERLDFEAKNLQTYVKDKSLLISERGALADKISPGVLKSMVTLTDKKR